MEKQLTFKDYFIYSNAALRTLHKQGEAFDTGHMGLGIATEYFELKNAIKNKDYVNIGEEIGDINWYTGNLMLMFFNKEDKIWNKMNEIYFIPQYSILTISEHFESVENHIEKITDICKKRLAYDKKIENFNQVLGNHIIELHRSLVSILLDSDIKPYSCLSKNIAKLYKRYPEKFDSFLAMNRDLEKEYEVLKS